MTCPAIRQLSLLSIPHFLRVNIVAPLNSAGLPVDYHCHGPIREYETLDLSQLTPQSLHTPVHYTLRAAIMYSKHHHWTCVYNHTPVFVSDEVSRIATAEDLKKVALCARILIYERTSHSRLPVPPESECRIKEVPAADATLSEHPHALEREPEQQKAVYEKPARTVPETRLTERLVARSTECPAVRTAKCPVEHPEEGSVGHSEEHPAKHSA